MINILSTKYIFNNRLKDKLYLYHWSEQFNAFIDCEINIIKIKS